MIQFIDLHQPAIVDAVLKCPPGMALKLAEVPAGGSFEVRDGRWLSINDGADDATFTIDVGTDADLDGLDPDVPRIVMKLSDLG